MRGARIRAVPAVAALLGLMLSGKRIQAQQQRRVQIVLRKMTPMIARGPDGYIFTRTLAGESHAARIQADGNGVRYPIDRAAGPRPLITLVPSGHNPNMESSSCFFSSGGMQ